MIRTSLFSLLRLGECEQDHGELLLGDLAVAVKVAPLHDRLLKVLQVVRVVVLEQGKENYERYYVMSSDVLVLPEREDYLHDSPLMYYQI